MYFINMMYSTIHSIDQLRDNIRQRNGTLMEINIFGIHIYRILIKLEKFNLSSYILLHIPQYNLYVLCLKGFLLYNEHSPIATAYKQYISSKSSDSLDSSDSSQYIPSIQNNFHSIPVEENETSYDFDIYTLDDDDPIIKHMYTFFTTYEIRLNTLDRILNQEMERKLKQILLHPIMISETGLDDDTPSTL